MGKSTTSRWLYGVSIGRVFYGESMFAKTSNASKFGFISIVNALIKKGFEMIDCQCHTDHLASLGAMEIKRSEFEKYLTTKIYQPGYIGKWTKWLI